jgi:hypothetical protein
MASSIRAHRGHVKARSDHSGASCSDQRAQDGAAGKACTDGKVATEPTV